MIHRGFTFRLQPTPEQETLFVQTAGVCRMIWNLALEQRRDHYRNFEARTGNRLNFVTQSRELTALRSEVDFVREVSQTAQQYVLVALEDAFQRFWKGQADRPKPKKRGKHDAFTVAGRNVKIERLNKRWGNVFLPKIGWIRCRMPRDIKGCMTEVTASRTNLGWQVSIGCKWEGEAPDPGGAVGIDRGVTVPLMCSDGSSYLLPEQIDVLDRRARKAQRIASKRKRGSRRHAKAQRAVARLRAKQARVRKHWAHCATTDICSRSGTIVIERLHTKQMTKSAAGTKEEPGRNVAQKRGLNRSILNVGWHQIETMLFYKAHRIQKVNPAYSSQTCSCCGTVDRKSRKSQALFVCTACGFRDNADHNAAVNILNRGNTPGVEGALRRPIEARTRKNLHGS